MEIAQKLPRDRHQKALKLIQDAIVFNPRNIQAYLLRGRILASNNRLADAREDFLQVLDIDSGNERALHMIEKIRQKTGGVSYEIKDKRLYNSGYEHKLIYSPRSK